MKETLSILSGLLFVVGFVPYIRAIQRKEMKPAKTSWIIWASLDTITLTGMFFKDTVNSQIIGAVLGAWVVAILALKYGTLGWTKLDKLCLGGAILGISLWQVFSDPIFGIVTSSSVAFLGSIPTFMSAWKDPSCENKLTWTIFWVSCVCAVIAIPHWTLADATQPITFFTIETIMMYILYVRPLLQNIKERRRLMVLKRPIRDLSMVLKYWRPKRLTLDNNPRVHAWLWWNF